MKEQQQNEGYILFFPYTERSSSGSEGKHETQ